MKPKKVIAYYFRTENEIENINDTVQMQRLLNHAAKNHNIKFAVFADNGFSGDMYERPSFGQMVNLMKMGMLDRIIITEPERISSNVRMAAEFFGEANKYSVIVETVLGDRLTDNINAFSDALKLIFSAFGNVKVKSEFELNRAWIYEKGREDEDAIGEKNFVVDAEYLESIFKELFPDENDMDSFLDAYEPETDGERIYQRAVKDGRIKEEFISIGGKILSVNI